MRVDDLLKSRYPKQVKLFKGKMVAIRPIKVDDERALIEFFKTVPLDDRIRFADDVTNPQVVHGWCASINFGKVIPLLAVHENKIVADATLHLQKKTWMRHVGKIRVSVAETFRGQGVATAIIREIEALCEPLGIAILSAELMSDQKQGIRVFDDMEYICVATLPQHVLDLNRQPHDLVVYQKNIFAPERLAEGATVKIDEVDVGGGG